MDSASNPKKTPHSIMWPVTITIASLIIGGSIYASQLSKQKSIEKQQQIDLQENINAEKAKTDLDKAKEGADQTEVFRKECVLLKESNSKKYTDFINSCTGAGGKDFDTCANSPAGKILAEGLGKDFIATCIDGKRNLLY